MEKNCKILNYPSMMQNPIGKETIISEHHKTKTINTMCWVNADEGAAPVSSNCLSNRSGGPGCVSRLPSNDVLAKKYKTFFFVLISEFSVLRGDPAVLIEFNAHDSLNAEILPKSSRSFLGPEFLYIYETINRLTEILSAIAFPFCNNEFTLTIPKLLIKKL